MTALPGAVVLSAGDLEAQFLPERGMLGASLTLGGVELLRRVGDLEAAAAKGATAGIPVLYPWANRLAGLRYRAADREATLDPASHVLHFDGSGLPIHGVPWSRLYWNLVDRTPERVTARLDWDRPELLAVFPYPHRVTLQVALSEHGLAFVTTVSAGTDGPVPVTFGFHPYLGLPGSPRERWRLELPALSRLALDTRGIPTGREAPAPASHDLLSGRSFDDAFAVPAGRATLAISDATLRLTVELVEGYRFAQIYSPEGSDFVALEPMTAPANALASGRSLRMVEPGAEFRAVWRLGVERVPS